MNSDLMIVAKREMMLVGMTGRWNKIEIRSEMKIHVG